MCEVDGGFGGDGITKDSVGVLSEFGHTIKQHGCSQYSSSVAGVNDFLSRSIQMLKCYMDRLGRQPWN